MYMNKNSVHKTKIFGRILVRNVWLIRTNIFPNATETIKFN